MCGYSFSHVNLIRYKKLYFYLLEHEDKQYYWISCTQFHSLPVTGQPGIALHPPYLYFV